MRTGENKVITLVAARVGALALNWAQPLATLITLALN